MRKATLVISSALLILVLGGACFAFLRINSTLREARQRVDKEGNLAFDILTLDSSSQGTKTGFEPLPSPNDAVTGAAFGGRIYLAGPGGLAGYSSLAAGVQPTLLRTGLDLPPAPITGLATGRLHGTPSPYLIAATHGEGLLFFTEDSTKPVRQLRPADATARDITAILPLASGDLLIGTRRAGLLIYDGKTLRLFRARSEERRVGKECVP